MRSCPHPLQRPEQVLVSFDPSAVKGVTPVERAGQVIACKQTHACMHAHGTGHCLQADACMHACTTDMQSMPATSLQTHIGRTTAGDEHASRDQKQGTGVEQGMHLSRTHGTTTYDTIYGTPVSMPEALPALVPLFLDTASLLQRGAGS